MGAAGPPAQQAQAQPQPIPPPQAAVLFELRAASAEQFADPARGQPGGTNLPAQAPGQGAGQFDRCLQQLADRAQAACHQFGDGRRRRRVEQCGFIQPEFGQAFQRQVQSAALVEVGVQVLQEVDQLQRRAQCIRLLQPRGFGTPAQMQQQPADRVGRAPAVIGQPGLVRVAGLPHVLAKRRKQLVQQNRRQVVAAAGVGAGRARRVVHDLAGQGGVQALLQRVDRRQPLPRR